jgi:hypothetical protein
MLGYAEIGPGPGGGCSGCGCGGAQPRRRPAARRAVPTVAATAAAEGTARCRRCGPTYIAHQEMGCIAGHENMQGREFGKGPLAPQSGGGPRTGGYGGSCAGHAPGSGPAARLRRWQHLYQNGVGEQ